MDKNSLKIINLKEFQNAINREDQEKINEIIFNNFDKYNHSITSSKLNFYKFLKRSGQDWVFYNNYRFFKFLFHSIAEYLANWCNYFHSHYEINANKLQLFIRIGLKNYHFDLSMNAGEYTIITYNKIIDDIYLLVKNIDNNIDLNSFKL